MSKQLAISASFAVFTMAAFALSATPDMGRSLAATPTGATAHAAAPALGLPDLGDLAPALFDLAG